MPLPKSEADRRRAFRYQSREQATRDYHALVAVIRHLRQGKPEAYFRRWIAEAMAGLEIARATTMNQTPLGE